MIHEQAAKAVKGFAAHGVVFHDMIGDQVIGDCPFTGGLKKFYVNFSNRLWDSKTAGFSGNFSRFLELVSKANAEAFAKDAKAQSAVAASRQLPKSAFQKWGIGWDGEVFTIPVRNGKGDFVDLRTWKPGKKTMSTPGAVTGLFGHEQLSDPKRKGEPVYLCEGEWDCIALDWLLRLLKVPGICVGVPGANTLKTEWVPSFNGRDVTAFYDHDEAGEAGEMRCFELLASAAASLRFVVWPAGSPEKFDLRDWIVAGAVLDRKPRACWASLQKLVTNTRPRRLRNKAATEAGANGTGSGEGEDGDGSGPKKELAPITREELFTEYQKWLFMADDTPLAIMFGTCFANRMEGDPLWIFLVAPPGGMKSELLMSISDSAQVYSISSLTPHALVSGASWVGGEDPSLIPKLDGKVLTIKDFTTTLTMHPMARDEIFGQLRDVYDGKFEKQFGNGIIRRYKSTFGIIAGVTPAIDSFASLNQGLGERFLKYRLEGNLHHENEEARILKAISNINKEVGMRKNLNEAAERMLAMPMDEPDIPMPLQLKIVQLAMWSARMRGIVNRDRYNNAVMLNKASYEIGTRLGKQYSKLAKGVSMYYGDKVVGERAYGIVCRVAASTIPDKVEEIIHAVYSLCPDERSQCKTKEIQAHGENLTQSTVFRTLEDLAMVGVVQKRGSDAKYQWALDSRVRDMIKRSGVYEVPRLG